MLQYACWPKPVANWWHVLRPMFHPRHHLVFCWLLGCQAIYQKRRLSKG
jgi:hypothetical protein